MKIKIFIILIVLTIAIAVYAQPIIPGGTWFFEYLHDTPSTYSGQAGKYLKVNTAEDALEFTTVSAGGGSGDLLADGTIPLTANWDVGNYDLTFKAATGDGTIEGATLTEGGNAVYNATETPGGELGGTWASPTLDDSVSVSSWSLTSPTFLTGITATDLIDSAHYVADSIDNEHINWADITNLDNAGAIIVADTADATSFVALWESATGSLAAKSDAGLTYNATTANLATTTFTGAFAGNSTTTTTASAGDAAVDFFGAGVDAVVDATTCTDIEGTGLSIAGGVLNWSAASTDLTDTAALLYETELDDFAELDTQIADKALINLADGGTFTGNIIANANLSVGNATTTAGVLTLLEDDDDGANFASFMVPALAANTVYTLPPDDGDNTEVLQTNGGGTLTWVANAGGGATAWDDISDPDNNGLTTITFDNAELNLFTGNNDAAVSFWTIQNTDADHAGGNMYLLDLDYSADDGDVDADFIKFQDSGSVVMTIQQDGEIATDGGLTAGGTVEGATITEGGNAVPNATDHLGFFGGTTSAELLAEISDETGTGKACFATAPTFTTSITITGADASPDAAGEIQYDSTVAGMSGGALRWFDNDSVRLLVDLETDAVDGDDDKVVAYDSAADGFYMKADADSGGATAWDDIGDPDAAATVDFVTYTQTIDIGVTDDGGAKSGLILDVTGLGAGVTDVIALEITTATNNDADYIPIAIYDDSGVDNDLLFSINYQGQVTFKDGGYILQPANEQVWIGDNSDYFNFNFGGTDCDIVWSDGVLNLRSGQNGVDAIVEIEGKDAGEKGILRVLSDGDDKYIELYHDDTDAYVSASSGDLYLVAVGGDIQLGDENIVTTGTIASGAITTAVNIKSEPKHLIFTIIDPLATQTEDNEICIWPAVPAALTVTKIQVTLDSAANEVAGDLKWADAFIGLAGATVINPFDTTNGVLVDAAMVAGAVASGKCIYISFDSAPNTAIKQMSVDITWDYD